jgi:hypothetical protein
MRATHLIRGAAAAAFFALPAIAPAQLANPSTAATALGGAYTARAQGYEAVSWNPANLAMPGNPGFSFTLLGIDGQAGIKPIDLDKVSQYSGKYVPYSVRQQWLADVTTQGGQSGGVGGGLTELGLSLGPIAFQFNTKLSTDLNLAPDAVEAVLFGNTGTDSANHQVKTLNLANSSFQTAVYSTGALSYGMRLPMVPLADFAVGITAKYTVGHALLLGQDAGSAIDPNAISVNFPYVLPDSNSLESGNAGSGVGIDLGASWKIPGFRFGVSAKNLVNTFKWDTTKMATRSAVGLFNSSGSDFQADSVDKPYGTAPAPLRARVAGLKFKPSVSAGMSFDWLPRITLSADIRQQVGDGIEVGPKSTIAAGAELRLIPLIPLRGGVALMDGGIGLSGGFGLHLFGFEAGVAGFVRKVDGGTASGGTLNLISIR